MYKIGTKIRNFQLMTRSILRSFRRLKIESHRIAILVKILREINTLDTQVQNQVACHMEGIYQVLLLQERLMIVAYNAVNSALSLHDAIILDLKPRMSVNTYTVAGMYVVIEYILKKIQRQAHIEHLERDSMTRLEKLELDINAAIPPIVENNSFLSIEEGHVVANHLEEAMSIMTEFLEKL